MPMPGFMALQTDHAFGGPLLPSPPLSPPDWQPPVAPPSPSSVLLHMAMSSSGPPPSSPPPSASTALLTLLLMLLAVFAFYLMMVRPTDEARQLATLVGAPLLACVCASVVFPGAVPASGMPYVNGLNVAMLAARIHSAAVMLHDDAGYDPLVNAVRRTALVGSVVGAVVRVLLVAGSRGRLCARPRASNLRIARRPAF